MSKGFWMPIGIAAGIRFTVAAFWMLLGLILFNAKSPCCHGSHHSDSLVQNDKRFKMIPEQSSLVEKSQKSGAEAHARQNYGSHPCTTHLNEVLAVLVSFGTTDDQDLLAASQLHDVLEDGPGQVTGTDGGTGGLPT